MKNWKKELTDLRNTLDLCFADDTANPGSKRDIPSAGHCAIVAMLIQEMYGGEYVSTGIAGQSHWYNKIYSGKNSYPYLWLDLTGDQFGFGKVDYRFDAPIYPSTRMRSPDDLNDNTKDRFAIFRERYYKNKPKELTHDWCREISPEELAELEKSGKLHEIDVEAELFRIVNTEIRNEFISETGKTPDEIELDHIYMTAIMNMIKSGELDIKS